MAYTQFKELTQYEMNMSEMDGMSHAAQPTEESTISPVNISLAYDHETRELKAEVIPTESGRNDWTPESIQNLIVSEGHDSVKLNQSSLMKLMTNIREAKVSSVTIGVKPEFTKVEFIFDQTTSILRARLSPTEENPNISLQSLQTMLEQNGYDNFFFEPNAIMGLNRSIANNERGDYDIAKKKNAEVQIEYDDEFMVAYITLTPPYGGRALDDELLNIALKNAEVDLKSCDKDILKNIITNQQAERVEFARGTHPQNGKDTQFTALVDETIIKKPSESKTGKIDTREVLDFTTIEPGTPLMKRSPAQEGVNGYNVKGQVIPAVDGNNIPFCDSLTGAEISADDPNLLIANAKGHPVILKDGVKVDKTLTVTNVALSTGHITFDGSLLVRGEVMPGMKINVTGDIIVEGVVTNATLRAKNNITVKCGVIGAEPEDKENITYTCHLKAGGDITAQYINQTELSAGHNIYVKEYMSHCHAEAKEKIYAGSGGGKGRIFGGDCYAQNGIEAKSIGADGIATPVTAGSAKNQQKQYNDLLKSRDHREEQLEKLKTILKKQLEAVKSNPSDSSLLLKAQAVKKVVNDLQAEIEKIKSAIDKVEYFFKQSRHAEVKISQSVFPNVLITINGASFSIRQEGKGGRFVKEGSSIRWNNR